jgi:hypothetical protein
MKKITKVVLGMFLAVTFGAVLGSNTADASVESVGDRYHIKKVSIQSVMDPNRVVDWSRTNDNEIIMYDNHGTWNQEWRMTYIPRNDTYRLMTREGLAGITKEPVAFLRASLRMDPLGNQYLGTENSGLGFDADEWRLIPAGTHPNGDVYMLENRFFGTVMDIANHHVYNNTSLILHRANGGDNQRFILHVLGDA